MLNQSNSYSACSNEGFCKPSYENNLLDSIFIDGNEYIVHNVPGDGSCLFHALSLQLCGSYEQTRELRKTICAYIVTNWENWCQKVSIYHSPSKTKYHYFSEMVEGNGWGTACEIEAAAQILGLKISVWLAGTNQNNTVHYMLQVINPLDISEHNKTVSLLLSNQHFHLLKRKHHPCFDHSYAKTRNNTNIFPNADHNYVLPPTAQASPTERNCLASAVSQKSDTNCNLISPCVTQILPNDHNAKDPAQSKKSLNDHNYAAPVVSKIFPTDHNCPHPISSEIHTNSSMPIQTKRKKELRKNTVPSKMAKKKHASTQSTKPRKLACIDIDGKASKDCPKLDQSNDNQNFQKALEAITNFEKTQMSYKINHCSVCHERRIEMKMSTSNICKRCYNDKGQIKMFSTENNMTPGNIPTELQDLSLIEQQLISRISPCINVHLLKHGGIGSSGHCVTFPQNVNEPAQIFPRLPSEISVIKVRKQGKNDTSKEFRIRRYVVQSALAWLKSSNPSYADIIISNERLHQLPIDGELPDIHTLNYSSDTKHNDDAGPAPYQVNPEVLEGETNSCVILPEETTNVRQKVQNLVDDIVSGNTFEVKENKKKNLTIPWPTQSDIPLSEFTTQNFFSMAFPALFPNGSGDFHMNRPRTCSSMAEWADHLLWFEDGRFARHPYFKFIVHNMIMRKRALDNSTFVVDQHLGESHFTVSDLKDKLEAGDHSFGKKIVYFGACLRGTTQYWGQRSKELRSLIHFKINEGCGLPSFFTTGSCAEYHFKPLRRLLQIYHKETTGTELDIDNRSQLFTALQGNTHILAKYFDLRTQNYFNKVMGPAFGVDTYWYRQEFAKSRGMIHWHGLCWRKDKEPHNLLHAALQEGLSDENCAVKLSQWAESQFGLSASHPAGTNEQGEPRKDCWPPPEGTAPAPPEEKNPLVKLLTDICDTQETLLEDYLLLCNRINIHRCSDYCLRPPKSKYSTEKICRMDFGTLTSPGKVPRPVPAIVKDKHGSLRLEMQRDHPMLVQHSRIHTQGWRANGDISLILSKSQPECPDVEDIIAVETYVSGYACKGNQPTGAVVDLFHDLVRSASEDNGATTKSLVSKLLMDTVNRDITAVEASFELSSLPLYRSSHSFKSVSLSGFRVLEKNGVLLTKSTIVDKYLQRHQTQLCSLYDFICNMGKVPVLCGQSTQPSWPLTEEYSKTMLLLHWPNWRKLTDIKDDKITWVSKMHEFLNSPRCPNFLKAEIERAHKHLDEKIFEQENSECQSSQQLDWMQTIQPNKIYQDTSDDFKYDTGGADYDWSQTSYNYPDDLGTGWMDSLQNDCLASQQSLSLPEVDISLMNNEQSFAFNITMQTLLNYVNSSKHYKPLRLIVGGTAGSGKSYLIKCLVKAIKTIFNSNKCVQILCPTGNSANIISGVTLHSFLKIPCNNKGRDMKAPDGAKGEALQNNCEGVEALLVDERSMIGAATLGWMEFMCRCSMKGGKNSQESWGGIPVVIFFGDDVQLPPVLDSPVYFCRSTIPAAMHGVMVWKEFSNAVILSKIVRQGENEKEFRDVLGALREYKLNSQQAKWLQSFQWSNLRKSHGDGLLQKMESGGLYIFPCHKDEWLHNKSKLLQLNNQYPIVKIDAICEGPHSKSLPSDKAGGLQRSLYLCKMAKVMLTTNLAVSYGLYNGATGTIKDIIFKNGKQDNEQPDVVIVHFPKYKGPPFIEEHPNLIPIVPIERRADCSCHKCKRTQLPLRLGWACTIHKCQGITVGEGEANRYIVIHPGSTSFESRNPGLLFVALSRAKSAGSSTQDPDFAWHPSVLVNEDRLCHKVITPVTVARTKEIERIKNLYLQTKKKFSFLTSSDSADTILNEIFNKQPEE